MHEPRWGAFFAARAKAGLRPGEAVALRPDDISLSDPSGSSDGPKGSAAWRDLADRRRLLAPPRQRKILREAADGRREKPDG
jgi:integrase